jgi:hypothetical protein
MTTTPASGAKAVHRRRFAGAAVLLAAGTITAAAFLGATPAVANAESPGPTIATSDASTQDAAKLNRDHRKAMKDTFKKTLDLNSQGYDNAQ